MKTPVLPIREVLLNLLEPDSPGREEEMLRLLKPFAQIPNEMKRWYRNGHEEWLLKAINYAFMARVKVPAWAQRAFTEAYAGRGKSWDEVFGRPEKKGAISRRRRFKELDAFKRIEQLHEEGDAIDEHLFAKVGKEVGLGGKNLSRIYYSKPNRVALAGLLAVQEREIGLHPDRETLKAWLEKQDLTWMTVRPLFSKKSARKTRNTRRR